MKKRYTEFYKESKKVRYIDLPPMIYLTYDGSGNPGESLEFQEGIELLYKFSYAIRMSYKGDNQIENYETYVVGPLEGIWTTIDELAFDPANKDNLKFKLLINQPAFFTIDVFHKFKELLLKDNPLMEKINYEVITEGKAVQILHLGPYDNEPETLKSVYNDLDEKNLKLLPWTHHEIYLSDNRRTVPEKLRTIVRYQIEEKS